MRHKQFFLILGVLTSVLVCNMIFVSCDDDHEEPKTEEQATSKLTGKWKVRSFSLSDMGINYGNEITFNSNGTVEVGNKMGTYSYNPSTGEFTLKLGDAVITGTITFNGDSATITFTNNSGEQQTLDLRYDDGTFEVEPNGVVAVDLGLPSGTLWATMNVGASKPEEYGDYFAWGETEGYNSGKILFYWSTYKWCNGSEKTLTKYCTYSSYGNNGFTDNKTELDPEDDAAYVNWGKEWRMPTFQQLCELKYQCKWTWKTINNVKGYLVEGKNGNAIFLPAAGECSGNYKFEGSTGLLWSRTLRSGYPFRASCLIFTDSSVETSFCMEDRNQGQSIRPVRHE